MNREFKRLIDIYSIPDKEGKQKLIKKNVIQKITLDTDKIQLEEYINQKGNPVKNKCNVRLEDNYYTLAHSYSEIYKLIQPTKVQGFKYKNKK